jgi:hypothetical protein
VKTIIAHPNAKENKSPNVRPEDVRGTRRETTILLKVVRITRRNAILVPAAASVAPTVALVPITTAVRVPVFVILKAVASVHLAEAVAALVPAVSVAPTVASVPITTAARVPVSVVPKAVVSVHLVEAAAVLVPAVSVVPRTVV